MAVIEPSMTTKEFFAKHYGSLSAGVFALGLLAVLGVYGSGFDVNSTQPQQQPAEAEPTTPVPPSEDVTPQQNETPARDESPEPDKDPLEQAMADEAAKAEERREALREEINKGREEEGLPPLPAQESSDNGE